MKCPWSNGFVALGRSNYWRTGGPFDNWRVEIFDTKTSWRVRDTYDDQKSVNGLTLIFFI